MPASCGGIFDYDRKVDQLNAVNRELEDPKVWDNAERAQELAKEKKTLEDVVLTLDGVAAALKECSPMKAPAATGTKPRALARSDSSSSASS